METYLLETGVADFHYELDDAAYQKALDRDGSYILRSNAIHDDAAAIWSMYMQLVHVESAFKSMKSDLAIRPIWHQVQPRVEVYVFVGFMGYCLLVVPHRTRTGARDAAGEIEPDPATATPASHSRRPTSDDPTAGMTIGLWCRPMIVYPRLQQKAAGSMVQVRKLG